MPTPQSFRSAFNGFNREDVVHYIEFINHKHTTEVNQLKSEAAALQSKLEETTRQPDLALELEALRQERDALQARCAELEEQLAQAQEAKPAVPAAQCQINYELETYRRAERTEREARARADQVYHQTNSALADATAKVDAAAEEIGQMTDAVMAQLSQLQAAVTGSKQALKDAAASMYTIRPGAIDD